MKSVNHYIQKHNTKVKKYTQKSLLSSIDNLQNILKSKGGK